MSEIGLSYLLATMMAIGGVPALDVRDHRPAHGALVRLINASNPAADALLVRYQVRRNTRPDPLVGVRVFGVTEAIWDAVRDGLLVVRESGRSAHLQVNPEVESKLRTQFMQLPAPESSEIYRIATAWAASSTSRKNTAKATMSPSPIRRVNLA
jgi:hypothetical protein